MELAAGSGMAGKKMRFICNTLHGWKVDTGVDVMLSSFAQLGPLLWLSREYTQQRSCMRSFADNPLPPPYCKGNIGGISSMSQGSQRAWLYRNAHFMGKLCKAGEHICWP